MAVSKTAKGKARLTPKTKTSSSSRAPPRPFKPAPQSLQPLLESFNPQRIYIAHVDRRPAVFKRKIFLVPVAMNLAVVALFLWRAYAIVPWYLDVLTSTLGYENATTVRSADLTQSQLVWLILGRGGTFFLDFLLILFVWPWPYEFVVGGSMTSADSSPCLWRWAVGFRNDEIYVRRSRAGWDQTLGSEFLSLEEKEDENNEGRKTFWSNVRAATSTLLLSQKTGYLTMDGHWDLDWAAMVDAHRLVDAGKIHLDQLTTLVFVHHEELGGWLIADLGPGGVSGDGEGGAGKDDEDERRRQVFKFRDALASVGQEDLFFRWIEVVQFETDRPGGFTPERQMAVAKQIRELFMEKGIDFDEFWRDSVGGNGLAGMD